MNAVGAVLTIGLLMCGCSQVSDQFYSKKNFTTQSFNADIAECKHQNPSFVAIQSFAPESEDRRTQIDDAMVRDCMKAKGYTVQADTK